MNPTTIINIKSPNGDEHNETVSTEKLSKIIAEEEAKGNKVKVLGTER